MIICKRCYIEYDGKPYSRLCNLCRKENEIRKRNNNLLYKIKNKDKIEIQQKIYRNDNKSKKKEYNLLNKDLFKE